MRLSDCHNVADFRRLAKARLPWPVFDYIDGGADDEVSKDRSTAAFDDCDLVPSVLAGVGAIDLSVTVLGRALAMPFFLSPTGFQRLFHRDGELAVGRAASRFDTFFGLSSLSNTAIEEVGAEVAGPKLFQLYVHRDRGLNRALIERAKAAGFDALALTVDTVVAGNRERCRRSGFSSPPRLTLRSALGFATHPRWTIDFLTGRKFELSNVVSHVSAGTERALSVAEYVDTMFDPAIDWAMAEAIRADWDGPFCLKGVMSVADARRAVAIGASAIMVSNHGGRQLDGSRAPFDQLAEIVDAVGDRIEVICDGGIRRGSHVLKALSVGATACSGGRAYLYALAAAGQPGVEAVLGMLRAELTRGMALMGAHRIADLSRDNLRWR